MQAHSESEPNWGAVARDATEMIWQKTVDALAQQEHPPVSAHMGFGGAYAHDADGHFCVETCIV
jgi:hypothetical protein